MQNKYIPRTRPMSQATTLPLDPGLRRIIQVHFTAHLSRSTVRQILL